MPVELADQFPFSVDTWSTSSLKKPHHFLTHAHSDHIAGINLHAKYPIYCSFLTMKLVLHRHPHLHESLFVTLKLEEPMPIAGGEPFTVTAFDANHCAGAVMLLFEGDFGNVLHTGDCRLSVDCLLQLPRKYLLNQDGSAVCALDYIFLDCTFAKEHVMMPSKSDAIQQVLNCIWANPKAPTIYLACDLLGHEELLQAISNSFGVKIYVDKNTLPDYFVDIMTVAPELITTVSESTKFQICEGFPKLYEKAKRSFAQAYATSQEEALFIRPSTQWYTYKERLEGAGSGVLLQDIPRKTYATRKKRVVTPTEAQRDQFGIWHVCYSIHSCRNELETALHMLSFKNVISTTDCSITGLFSWCVGSHFQENQVKRVRFLGKEVEQIISTQLKLHASENNTQPCSSGQGTVCAESPRTGSPWLESKSQRHEPLLTFFDKSLPLFGIAGQWLSTSPPLCSIYEDWTSKGERQVSYLGDKSLMNEANNLPACQAKEPEILSAIAVPSNVKCSNASQAAAQVSTALECDPSAKSPMSSQNWKQHDNLPGVVKESTRNLYRMLHVSVPRPLPSLLDIRRNNARF